ncbi:MAG: Coenzyme F420 hydrogenase/dehydrogenase, beta subunit C-terminal domain [Bacilli bacterium]|nr:Coenzyme F420 hydrogenase/dehydrogenase, beta subunit C-terminal domain [Bacilli bacterium]
MSEIVKKSLCCGCHACYNICPKKAITMKDDKKGFKYPIIDNDICINCNLCKNVCPILNNKNDVEKKVYAYACYNKNIDERLKSSSGGIFILFAKEIIKKNGVVFGASFDKKFNVVHSYVEKIEELGTLMTSKYTQSIIGNAYSKVKYFLKKGRYVLFTGTPCQIEGLYSFLKKDYEKLYTQDIICHGVPSPKVWRKYLDYQKSFYKDSIKNISFRDKSSGWKLYRIKILFKSNFYSEVHSDDLYMQVFLKNVCLRDSCYNCQFKKKYRKSDVTLADYWGVDNVHPEMNDDNGISLLIINSDKGKELFNSVKGDMCYLETDFNKAIKYNSAMLNSVNHCKKEKIFFDKLDVIRFDKLIKKCVPKRSFLRIMIDKLKRKLKKGLHRKK